ncbi:MAG: DUF1987 domain-containing protein [Flavobacteriales bacterium]|jgi:hypothetical protein|nr:DUF1987 domain-containing protein [Flavobacteriales bacterium]
MEALKLELTENTPKIVLDHTTHALEFEGDSRPEDVQKFFQPVMNWLNDYESYVQSAGDVTLNANFKLEYFNSSSAKYIMDIILKLGKIAEPGNVTLNINWHYDEMDEDMLDAGEEFEDMLDVEFNFVEIPD